MQTSKTFPELTKKVPKGKGKDAMSKGKGGKTGSYGKGGKRGC